MLFRYYILCEMHAYAYVAMHITRFSEIEVNFVIFKSSTEWIYTVLLLAMEGKDLKPDFYLFIYLFK